MSAFDFVIDEIVDMLEVVALRDCVMLLRDCVMLLKEDCEVEDTLASRELRPEADTAEADETCK